MKSCKRGVQCSFYILGADKQDYEYRTSLTHIFRRLASHSWIWIHTAPSNILRTERQKDRKKKYKNTKIRKGNTQNLPHPHIPPDCPLSLEFESTALPQIFYAQKDKKTERKNTKIRKYEKAIHRTSPTHIFHQIALSVLNLNQPLPQMFTTHHQRIRIFSFFSYANLLADKKYTASRIFFPRSESVACVLA